MTNKIVSLDDSEYIPITSQTNEETKDNNDDENSYHLLSEKILSILTHIFIMICFATYFFFEYIINIEKKLFLSKIDKYFDYLNNYYVNQNNEYRDIIIKYIMKHDNVHNYLYNEYKHADKEQEQLLHELKITAIYMVTFVSVFFILSLLNAIYIRQFIHWKCIIFENVLMFVSLGIFEYLFFTLIVIKHSPISNEELQYIMYNNLEKIAYEKY